MLEEVVIGWQEVRRIWQMRLNFCSPIHSASEVLVVQRATGRYHVEELGLSCWPVLAAGVAVFEISHQFAEHTSQIWWFCQDLESCSGSEEKAMAPHSSTLAWKIPWTEEPGRLQSMGSLRVRHDLATSLWLFTFMHWRRKWQPIPVFLPRESQGWGSLVGCRLWGCTESDMTEAT